MRRALVALIAAWTVASAVGAAAETVPIPIPAPKRPASHSAPTSADQPPRPPMPVAPDKAASAIAPPRSSEPVNPEEQRRLLVNKVSAYLSSVQTLVGDFVQVGPDGRRTEGQFFIQKPGRVKFSYKPPSPIDVIADGRSVVVRDRNLATQDIYPLSQTPLRFLLSDRIDLMRDTNLISVSADDTFVTVVVEERHVLTGTSRLMLMFGAKDMQLRQWTVTDPQGFDTTVAVYNLDTTKKPDPDMFQITYPQRDDGR